MPRCDLGQDRASSHWLFASRFLPAIVIAATPCLAISAQSEPELSGTWVLEAPSSLQQNAASPPAESLRVAVTPTTVSVDCSPATATIPSCGTHTLGSRGVVGANGRGVTKDVFWFGEQLVISVDDSRADAEQRAQSASALWSLSSTGKLEITVKRGGRSERFVYARQ